MTVTVRRKPTGTGQAMWRQRRAWESDLGNDFPTVPRNLSRRLRSGIFTERFLMIGRKPRVLKSPNFGDLVSNNMISYRPDGLFRRLRSPLHDLSPPTAANKGTVARPSACARTTPLVRRRCRALSGHGRAKATEEDRTGKDVVPALAGKETRKEERARSGSGRGGRATRQGFQPSRHGVISSDR